MKSLKSYITTKRALVRKKTALDIDTIKYLFRKIIGREYGKRGEVCVEFCAYKEGVLYAKTKGSVWSHELLLQKRHILLLMNREIGEDEVRDLFVV